MFSSSEELRLFYNRAKYFSNRKLHELEYYWRYNSTHPLHHQIHRIIESTLVRRGEKLYKYHRPELINYLDKCWAISNPMGRLSARLLGYISQFVERKDIAHLD